MRAGAPTGSPPRAVLAPARPARRRRSRRAPRARRGPTASDPGPTPGRRRGVEVMVRAGLRAGAGEPAERQLPRRGGVGAGQAHPCTVRGEAAPVGYPVDEDGEHLVDGVPDWGSFTPDGT